MVYRKIDRGLKERAIILLDHPEFCNDVCDILGVSLASVKRWRKNVWDFDDVEGCPTQSRASRKLLDEEKINQIAHLYYMTPSLLLDKIKEWIQVTHNIPISCSALCRYVNDAGFTYKKLKMCASERDEEAADQWMAETNAEFVAEQLVSIDETSKDGRTLYRRYGYAPKGCEAVQRAPFG